MAIEIPHMKLSHEKYSTRDLGGNYADLARELGGWSERVDDPGEIANAFLRARRQTEEGRAACSSSSPAPRPPSPIANSRGPPEAVTPARVAGVQPSTNAAAIGEDGSRAQGPG